MKMEFMMTMFHHIKNKSVVGTLILEDMELAIVTVLDIIMKDAKEHPNLETIKLIVIIVFIILAEEVRLQYMKNHRYLVLILQVISL
jgi:hypothetical protein